MENSRIKQELNTIHAPEALLQSTMAMMHEENAKQLHSPAQPDGEEYPELGKYYGKKKSWWKAGSFGAVLVTALAAVAITVFNRSSSDILWQSVEISDKPYYKAAESGGEHTVSTEEFEAQTNIPLLPYMTVQGYANYTCYEEEGIYSARLDYSGDSNCTLILSSEGSGIAASVDTGKYKEIEGRKVSFAKEKKSGMLAAIWKDDLGEYCLTTYGDEEAFMDLLNRILVLQKGLK